MSWLTEFRDAAVEAVVPNKVKQLAADPKAAAGSAISGLVKLVSPPKGNLTAAQIEAGQTGSANQGVGGIALGSSLKSWLLWGAVAVGGIYLIARKKRK